MPNHWDVFLGAIRCDTDQWITWARTVPDNEWHQGSKKLWNFNQEVVNPWHYTRHGQPVTKPETHDIIMIRINILLFHNAQGHRVLFLESSWADTISMSDPEAFETLVNNPTLGWNDVRYMYFFVIHNGYLVDLLMKAFRLFISHSNLHGLSCNIKINHSMFWMRWHL